MSFSSLNRTTMPQFIDRANKITPTSKPVWGKMGPAEMFAHANRSLELSLGEPKLADKSNPIFRGMLRWFVIDSPIPWPKGIKAPPAFFPDSHTDVENERTRYVASLKRFVDFAEANPNHVITSEVFGQMPMARWEKLNGRHLDHHMRQFGA